MKNFIHCSSCGGIVPEDECEYMECSDCRGVGRKQKIKETIEKTSTKGAERVGKKKKEKARPLGQIERGSQLRLDITMPKIYQDGE